MVLIYPNGLKVYIPVFCFTFLTLAYTLVNQTGSGMKGMKGNLEGRKLFSTHRGRPL